jgi:hypothetical protein
MGARNAAAAYYSWGHLSDRALRVLVFMALTAHDDHDPPRYWGGREMLAVQALGRSTPPDPMPGDESERANQVRRMRKADFQAVKEAVGQLTKAHALVVDKPAAPGRQAEYQIVLTPPRGRESLLNGVGNFGSRGRESLPDGVGEPYPRGENPLRGSLTEEELKEKHEEKQSPKATDSPGADLTYPQAYSILAGLPDLGTELIERTPPGEKLDTRVIAAAHIHLNERKQA